MVRLYAAFLNLQGRPALVVGGGKVAGRKAASLLEAGAIVTVVTPRVCKSLENDIARFAWVKREYRASDLDGQWLVAAATDDPRVNKQVSEDAARARVWCNVVDAPELCTFQAPSVLSRGLLQIAVSTGGASPALARRIRKRLETEFGPAYGEFIDSLADLRRHVRAKYPEDEACRRRLLEGFLDSSAQALLLERGDREAFQRELERWKSR
jgi:precorrin-2 dehydrogenase / sirohydrochlorin ferrochelatase